MKINNLSNMQFNFTNRKTSTKSKSEELWDKFQNSSNNNEKRKLLNQMIALNNCDEDEEDDGEIEIGRKPDPNEKVIKEFTKKNKQESIASKVAKGEYITEKERNYLEAHNPELLEKSTYFNYERKNLEQRIKNSKTKKEAKNIIRNARNAGMCVGDSSLNKVVSESINKAEENTIVSVKKKEEEENRKKYSKKKHINKYV